MSLSNTQYDAIMRVYNQRQFQNKYDQDRRVKEVYDRLPQIRQIDDAISAQAVACARRLLDGDQGAREVLKRHLEDLKEQKAVLLEACGFGAGYMDMRYHCPDCQDTGHIGNQKCHCFKQAIVDLLYDQSNLRHSLKRENFDTFQLAYYSDQYTEESTGLTPRANAGRALQTCRSFIENFDSSYENLLLYGNTGVGKTFLANCIAKELLDHSHTVIYLTAFQLFDALEKYAFQKREDPEAEASLDYILDCDLLIIDDLGTEVNNTFITSRLYLCLNERDLRQNSTVISTNLSLDDLSRNYSERIFSRLTMNYTLVKLVGEDIRLQKAFA